jgi:hypothetical protein
MKLEQAVRQSEDVDDEVLLDVVRALRRRVASSAANTTFLISRAVARMGTPSSSIGTFRNLSAG